MTDRPTNSGFHGSERIRGRPTLRVQPKRLRIVLLAAAFGCSVPGEPERAVHEFQRPDGRAVRCHEPPAELVARGIFAEVDARVPEVIEILRLEVDVRERLELLRPAARGLEALEALEFRLCVAWAQGVLGEEEYSEFLREVLPALRLGCEG